MVVARITRAFSPEAARAPGATLSALRPGRRTLLAPLGGGLTLAAAAAVASSGLLLPEPDPGLSATATAPPARAPLHEGWEAGGPPPVPTEPSAEGAPAVRRPEARTGVLEVRANRRVLVTLDGEVLGFTPLELEVPLGRHTLVATVPAREDTRQERQVVVRETGPATVTLVF